MRGTVLSIEEGGLVYFKPIDYPEIEKPLQIDLSFVVKYFEPGDLVRITEGKHKGETGQVIDVEGKKVSLKLD
jgi:transcription elongation factor